MSSQTVCCSCNIIKLAKMITVIEIGLSLIIFLILGYFGIVVMSHSMNIYLGITIGSFVIYWTYLATEFTGIHKKVRGLIIFSCVIRVISSVLDGVFIIMILCLAFHWRANFSSRDGEILVFYILISLVFTVLIMLYLIFRTWIQFRVFYADSDNLTLNNTIELQLLRPV